MHKSFCFLFFLLMVSPASVAAQCGGRDVGGSWDILISSLAAPESLKLTTSGTTISGTAELQTALHAFDRGKVTGILQGDGVSLSVEWSDNRQTIRESFTGTIGQDGKITGKARIWALAGSVEADWTSSKPMRCLFNTVNKLGVKPSTPTAPPASTTRAPYIIATPNNIPLPFGVTVGQSTIVWDGGKDHPYAEIWVKVDKQDERKVIELGKGSLPVTVEAGRTYVYILTDAGTTLATVTVKFLR